MPFVKKAFQNNVIQGPIFRHISHWKRTDHGVTSWPATTHKALISLDVSILWLIPGMVKIPNILAHSERLKRITMTVNGTIE